MVALILFGYFNAAPDQTPPSGGLLILTDATARPVKAKVNAEFWDMGLPGLTAIDLKIEFDHAYPGLHWYVIASGQYEIPRSTPTLAYCLRTAQRISQGRVTCPTEGTTYRAGGLGSVQGSDVDRISDSFDGYDDGTSSLLEGMTTRDPDTGEVPTSVEALIPIRTPARQRDGSDTYGTLAPIAAVNLGDFGFSGRVRSLASDGRTPDFAFADTATGRPMQFPDVTSIHVEYRLDSPMRSIAFASPPTAGPDVLAWNSQAVRTQPIRYILHDPVLETSLTRRAFLAGVFASLAVTCLILPVTRWFEGTDAERT